MADVIHGRGKKEEGAEIFQLFPVEASLSSALASAGRKQEWGGKGDFKVSPSLCLAENLNFQQVPVGLDL